jgi:hypothetical protein
MVICHQMFSMVMVGPTVLILVGYENKEFKKSTFIGVFHFNVRLGDLKQNSYRLI